MVGFNLLAQKPVINLTFTSVDVEQWVPLESITIKNITRGVDTTIFYPDTVLSIHYQVGINEADDHTNGFRVFQNFPNPVKNNTTINIYVPDKGKVNINISDVMGRGIKSNEQMLEPGYHAYNFKPGKEQIYFFKATWNGVSSSIKILNGSKNPHQICSLDYINHNNNIELTKSTKNTQDFSFDKGDNLIYVGIIDGEESGIFAIPKTDVSYTFQFATNIPCPGDSSVTYEGHTYNTIQIYSQCWLNENLNVGTKINGILEMTDDNTIEKYCFDDNDDNCDDFGGLYQWNEMMQYNTASGSQGICPPGWHIPKSGELVVLSSAVDSNYGIGDSEWYNSGYQGSDAGVNLKSENGWAEDGNGLDTFGFIALPAGQRITNGYFDGQTYKASFWSSGKDAPETAWNLALSYYEDGVDRNSQSLSWGKSVRCMKD